MKRRKKQDNLRYTDEYKTARKNVLWRDNYKCQYPGCKSRTKKWLQVHHIIPYAKSRSLITIEKNLITLCYSHHKSIHGKEIHYVSMFSEIIRKKYET